jgi:hypothetical protein
VGTGETGCIKTNKQVIGFVVVQGKGVYCDFVIVTVSSVDFYKFVEKPFRIVLVKTYSHALTDYSFDRETGVLLSSNQELFEFYSFFLYQNKGVKYFQGPTINVHQKYAGHGLLSCYHSCNLAHLSIVPLDKVQVMIAKLYNMCTFIELDGLAGSLLLRKLDQDSPPDVFLSIRIRPGGYVLRLCDNLLVAHNYGPQESFVFDVKKENEPETCVFMVKHQGSLDFDSKFVQIYYQSEIDPHFVCIGQDLYIDTINGRLLALCLYMERLVMEHPRPLEGILFTLRREKCLLLALSLLKRCLEQKMSPEKLTDFFNITNYAYKETAMLRKVKKKDEGESRESVGKKAEFSLRSAGGMAILLQSDMFLHVFKPFYEKTEDFVYFSQVLIAYINSLIRQDLHVHASHQYILAKVLIKLKNFKQLQYFLQYQVLNTNADLATLLTRLNSDNTERYPEVFQLGIDMMFRLKDYKSIVNILSQKGELYDALSLLSLYDDTYDFEQLRQHTSDPDAVLLLEQALSQFEARFSSRVA